MLLAGPGQVVNVQVFLYNPLITDPATRTALVIWNNVDGSVTSFSVRVIDYSTGMELSPVRFFLFISVLSLSQDEHDRTSCALDYNGIHVFFWFFSTVQTFHSNICSCVSYSWMSQG